MDVTSKVFISLGVFVVLGFLLEYFRSRGWTHIGKVKPDYHYNSKQLNIGTKVELEHTRSKALAKRIAKQHLNEHKDYYTFLVEMEKKMLRKR